MPYDEDEMAKLMSGDYPGRLDPQRIQQEQATRQQADIEWLQGQGIKGREELTPTGFETQYNPMNVADLAAAGDWQTLGDIGSNYLEDTLRMGERMVKGAAGYSEEDQERLAALYGTPEAKYTKELDPIEQSQADVFNIAADVALPGPGGQAGMFFGTKAARHEMAKALQTARKMYKPGTPARQGLLKTAERGIALGEKPATAWGPHMQDTAGAFDRSASERMLKETASQQIDQFKGQQAHIKDWTKDALRRRSQTKDKGTREMLDVQIDALDKIQKDVEGEVDKFIRDAERMETAMARNKAKYGTEAAELSRSYVSPWAKGSGTEFHEVGVHGMVAGLDPVQKNLVEGVMDQTNVGKWMAKHHGKPIPGQNVNYVFPEGWRDTPEEQLAWVLTEISEGRIPSQEAINTSQLDDLMRVLEGNF